MSAPHPSAEPSRAVDQLAPLARLASIDLVRLNALAELQTRVDRKYVLAPARLGRVLSDLPAGSEVLEIDGERALRYESQYYDTPALDSYFGAARGRRRRFKVRARTYLDSGGSFLEVKTRGSRSTTVKNRMAVTGGSLDSDAVSYAGDLLAEAGVPRARFLADALRPALVTCYRRVTVLLPAAGEAAHGVGDCIGDDPSRATIDVDLTWIAADGPSMSLPGTVIVETKSGRRAGAFDRALWRHGHRPVGVSKYATGMAALHPHLPAHRWRRVLDRHFSSPSAPNRAPQLPLPERTHE